MKNIKLLVPALLIGFSACNPEDNIAPETALLDNEIVEALNATIQDEYKAQMTYQRILDDFGDNTFPFVNIKKAEVKHAEALGKVMTNYSLEVPSNEITVEQIESFSTVQAACAAGVVAEIENIALYDSYLSMDLPADIRTVFTNNRNASEDKHLPAFQNCSK